MRIVFMGTPDFAVPSLRLLLEHGYPIVAVVTAQDKPAGRGLVVSVSPVKRVADERGLHTLQPERLTDPAFVAALRALKPDLIVVVAFRILPPSVFSIARLGAFNLHASLLPKYRGAAPIPWAIINGERETGVTTFFLRERVDTGNVIMQARTTIGENETAGELHDRLAEIGAEIVLHSVRLIESGKAVVRPQDESLASSAPKIRTEDCRIDWSRRASEVHNFVRGLSPRPGAFTHHLRQDGGKITLKVFRTLANADERAATAGEIVCADERLTVATGEGTIDVLELQQEGKRRLPVDDFLRGYHIAVGDKLQ